MHKPPPQNLTCFLSWLSSSIEHTKYDEVKAFCPQQAEAENI